MATYRAKRLQALKEEPTAFASDYTTTSQLDDAFWLQRAAFEPHSFLYGAFLGSEMVGMAGGYIDPEVKRSFIGYLVSIWVDARFRKQGIAKSLSELVVKEFRANAEVEVIHVAVTAGNDSARRIYESLGFVAWGVEPRAIRHDGRYYDEVQLTLDIR